VTKIQDGRYIVPSSRCDDNECFNWKWNWKLSLDYKPQKTEGADASSKVQEIHQQFHAHKKKKIRCSCLRGFKGKVSDTVDHKLLGKK